MPVEYRLTRTGTLPVGIHGRRIICCLCPDTNTWDKGLDDFAAFFPDAKTRYLEQVQKKPPRLGQVIFCKGEDEDTLIADMICRKDKPDAYDSDVHFGYLYSCFLQVVLKGLQANATVVVSVPGVNFREWQWRKLIPILKHSIEVTETLDENTGNVKDKVVTAIVGSPYDLIPYDKELGEASAKRKATRKRKKTEENSEESRSKLEQIEISNIPNKDLNEDYKDD